MPGGECGDAKNTFTEQTADAAISSKVGYGLDEDTEMGAVITSKSKGRIEGIVAQGVGGWTDSQCEWL